jgi:hypothetical protein
MIIATSIVQKSVHNTDHDNIRIVVDDKDHFKNNSDEYLCHTKYVVRR